jgi:hypothetical protein
MESSTFHYMLLIDAIPTLHSNVQITLLFNSCLRFGGEYVGSNFGAPIVISFKNYKPNHLSCNPRHIYYIPPKTYIPQRLWVQIPWPIKKYKSYDDYNLTQKLTIYSRFTHTTIS